MAHEPRDAEGETQSLVATNKSSFQDLIRNLGGGQALKQLHAAGDAADHEKLREQEEAEKKVFAADIDRLNKRLQDQKRGLLDPQSKQVQYWDMMTTVALVYTMFVTPYEVGLDIPTSVGALFVCNLIVTFVFLVDVFVQFFLPLPKKRGTESNSSYERRHWKLAQNYLTTYFFIDVVTIIPFDILVWQGAVTGEMKMMKILRIIRLLKVVKVLRASTILQRWENSFAIPSTKQQLSGFAFFTIVLLHWFSCLWAALPMLSTSQRIGIEDHLQVEVQTIMEQRELSSHYGLRKCTGCFQDDPSTHAICASACLTQCEREALASIRGQSEDFVFFQEPWTCRAAAVGTLRPDFADNPSSVYFTGLLVAVLMLVGSTSTISPQNISEYVFFTIVRA